MKPLTKIRRAPRAPTPSARDAMLITARGYELTGCSPKYATARAAHVRAHYRTNNRT